METDKNRKQRKRLENIRTSKDLNIQENKNIKEEVDDIKERN